MAGSSYIRCTRLTLVVVERLEKVQPTAWGARFIVSRRGLTPQGAHRVGFFRFWPERKRSSDELSHVKRAKSIKQSLNVDESQKGKLK